MGFCRLSRTRKGTLPSLLLDRSADPARIRNAQPGPMLGGTGDVYYAKLRRGGMGTGMPGFGPIFSPDETWLLVDYLWTFIFYPEGHRAMDEER